MTKNAALPCARPATSLLRSGAPSHQAYKLNEIHIMKAFLLSILLSSAPGGVFGQARRRNDQRAR
jgi:hypothetical protein